MCVVCVGRGWLAGWLDIHRVLVGKPAGRKPLGRPRRRWGYNMKMDLQEMG